MVCILYDNIVVNAFIFLTWNCNEFVIIIIVTVHTPVGGAKCTGNILIV